MMKKTLLMTLEYPPQIGGVANYYQNLVRALPTDRMIVLDNSADVLLFRHLWPRWMKGFWNTWKLIRKRHIECVLSGQILPLGTIAFLLYLVTGVPYVVMTHAMDVTLPFSDQGIARKRWLVKHILKNASAVTTVSQYTKQVLQSLGVPDKKIHLIVPCPHITPQRFVPSEKTLAEMDQRYRLAGKRVLLSVCRLVERKGCDTVIEALPHIIARHPDVVYVIAGNGPYAFELKKKVDALGLREVVRFVGKRTDSEIGALFKRCELFVMPSRQLSNLDVEGFGIVFLEANSYGKPVIGGKSGGTPDAVLHEQTGLLVNPEHATEVVAAIDRLLTDRAFAARLGNRGNERVQHEFQWNEQAARLERLISSL